MELAAQGYIVFLGVRYHYIPICCEKHDLAVNPTVVVT